MYATSLRYWVNNFNDGSTSIKTLNQNILWENLMILI